VSEAVPPVASTRWLGLDALRGLTIAAMILVNNPGRWGAEYQYGPLRHAAWHGCTFTDLVFPTFLFCAGVAIVPAFGKKLAAGLPRAPLVLVIVKRVLALLLLGMSLSAFPLLAPPWTPLGASIPGPVQRGVACVVVFALLFWFVQVPAVRVGKWLALLTALCVVVVVLVQRGWAPAMDPLLHTRFPGVLQRIGVCYGIAALLFLFTRTTTQRLVLVGCLFGYWALITLVPVPSVLDAGPGATLAAIAPSLDDVRRTLQSFVDQAVFGDHIYRKGSYDPEGLLSTIPALATCLFGVEAGRVLAAPRELAGKVRTLLVVGVALMVVGYAWSFALPLNKPLWTSSYAVWTAGIAFAALGASVWAFELRGWRALAHPLQVYGVNALLVFVGSGLLGRIVGRLITVDVAGKQVPLQSWLFDTALLSWAEPKVASLLFALLWVSGWYAVLALLFRRGLVWKV